MKIIIMGAGLMGVTTAYFLAREGHQVVVVEKQSNAGEQCSFANGGQLSYSHIDPWSEINFLSIIANFFKPSSFISGSKVFSPSFLWWFRKFIKNNNSKKNTSIAKNLFTLSTYSFKALDEIRLIEKDLKFHYSQEGILHFFRSKKIFERELRKLDFKKSIKCPMQVLTPEELIRKEPSLIKLYEKNKLAGGIFYKNDAVGDSHLFTIGLEKICREKYGVEFEYNCEVKNILTNHTSITGINTDKQVFHGDAYISALGAYGNKLLQGIKIDPQIYPIKGYSLSIETNDEFPAPKIGLTDIENKIVYSKLGNIFRGAGTIDIAGFSNYLNKKNLSFIKKSIINSFTHYGNINEIKKWCGLRPFRPNSTPLICKVSRYNNLFLNMGHGSLGWTLCAGSAKLMSQIVNQEHLDERFNFLQQDEKTIYKNIK